VNAQTTIQHVLHDLPGAATTTFLALFPIVNPLGGIQSSLLLPPTSRRKNGGAPH